MLLIWLENYLRWRSIEVVLSWSISYPYRGSSAFHSWPSSILCVHGWSGWHLWKPVLSICWWFHTFSQTKLLTNESVSVVASLNRDLEDKRLGSQVEGHFRAHKMQSPDTIYKKDSSKFLNFTLITPKTTFQKELTIHGARVHNKVLRTRHVSDISNRGLGRDLEHCLQSPTNLILQEGPHCIKLKSDALWNMPGCHGWTLFALWISGVDHATSCRN